MGDAIFSNPSAAACTQVYRCCINISFFRLSTSQSFLTAPGRSPPAPQQLPADTEIINKKVFFYSRTGGLYRIQRRGWTAQQMIQWWKYRWHFFNTPWIIGYNKSECVYTSVYPLYLVIFCIWRPDQKILYRKQDRRGNRFSGFRFRFCFPPAACRQRDMGGVDRCHISYRGHIYIV